MNLAEIVETHPGSATALRQGSASTTYGELRERSAALCSALSASGVGEADRVVLLLPTTPAFVAAYLAVLGTGAIAVPLNPTSPEAEIQAEARAVRPVLGLVGDPDPEKLRAVLGGVDVEALTVDELVAVATGEAPIRQMGESDPAVFLFTSGTAGTPKPAILTHGSLMANIDQLGCRAGLAPTAEDTGVLVVPPFHVFGLNAVLGLHLASGGRLVLAERFDPRTLLETLRTEKVTVLAGVPQVFAALAEVKKARADDLASLRLACSGAAPLDLETAERFEARFGVRVWQGYGLTEASPAVTFPDLSGEWRPESIGVPLPGVEVTLVDPDGAEVEPGDPGEMLVRGPNVFAGYFEDEVATAAVIDAGGRLHTGDIAVMDDDGSFRIVDRAKDLVIVSGFNVFPAEVEQVLVQHPAVKDAAVVGMADPEHGEVVQAFVVPAESAWPEGEASPEISASEIADFCAAYLARYKCPAVVRFVRVLPRGSGGKVLRRALA